MKGRVYVNKSGKGAPFFVKFPGVFRRFKSWDEAERFLTGLRYEHDKGVLDVRDYQKDQPLAFSALAGKWIDVRKDRLRDICHLKTHMGRAMDFFGTRNIKSISFGDIEDFLISLPGGLSATTKARHLETIHAFFSWVCKRDRKIPLPEFPKVKYQLGWRRTVDKETQQRIIEEVKRISYHINPKIWIGIKWLATYISIRPVELINIKEGDFDLSLGVVNVKYNKENKLKTVPLLAEDIELVKSFPRALPHVYFFRHNKAVSANVNPSKLSGFGRKHLYRYWKKACKNLGIEGVDLYGGTRHSSARALREHCSPEQIKRATMHSTNKAFERYFQIEMDEVRNVYAETKMSPRIMGKVQEIL